jgi:hypothetical protein
MGSSCHSRKKSRSDCGSDKSKAKKSPSDCGCDQSLSQRKHQPLSPRKPQSIRHAVPSIWPRSPGQTHSLVMRNTLPQIERLFQPTSIQSNSPVDAHVARAITEIKEELKNLYPSSYGGPPGPACNWRTCSNKGGCGTECVCHPAGWYGWRCIPKCCIRRDGYPPCRFLYKYDVNCTLPCHTWPGTCAENFFNPYHTYQGPYEYPKGQPNLTGAY